MRKPFPKTLKVLVDKRNLSVILPIYGYAVPFHISTLKNVVKNEDRDYVYLRFNFITPGQSFGKKDQSSVKYNFNRFETIANPEEDSLLKIQRRRLSGRLRSSRRMCIAFLNWPRKLTI